MASRLEALWPLWQLRLRLGPLELRLPTDEDLATLVDVARQGVHPPDRMPFLTPWTLAPSPTFERSFLQHHWRLRADWSPQGWHLDLGVSYEGQLVGCQGIWASEFAVTRAVETGSWLGQRFQGLGIGTTMRTAVLAFAFDHLGALEAHSGTLPDSPASAIVSRRLLYRENGVAVRSIRGQRTVEQRYRLTAQDWRALTRPEVEVEGLAACRDLFEAA